MHPPHASCSQQPSPPLRSLPRSLLRQETGFESSLRDTVSRLKPVQLNLFKKQDDGGRDDTHIYFNLIGEVRKAVFNAIDFLGYELWRRYILKGLDLLLDVCSSLRVHRVACVVQHEKAAFIALSPGMICRKCVPAQWLIVAWGL